MTKEQIEKDRESETDRHNTQTDKTHRQTKHTVRQNTQTDKTEREIYLVRRVLMYEARPRAVNIR